MMPESPIQASTTVYLASFAALLGALSMGLALGYTAPAFIDMDKDNSSSGILDPTKRESQKSLFASILAVGALIGGFLVEPCNKYLGRKKSLILYGVPFVVGWLLIAFANSFSLLIIGRILTGLCCGLISGTAPTYVVEIAPPQIRGLLGTSFQVMVTIGILLVAVLGTFLSWSALAGVSVVAAIGMSAMMLVMPETPQWLLGKGQSEEAEASLKRLRISSINDEFNQMTQLAQNEQQSGGAGQYSLATLTNREFYKPFMLALGLMFFQQFSGINAVLFYQSDIFKNSAPELDAAMATIYVCIAQVVATIIGSVLVDKTGRKALLIASGAGHAISLIVFGVYSNISESDKDFQSKYAWLALVSLIVFISSFSIGYGPIPWMMIPEFTSSRVRSMIASLATAFNWTCVYIVTANVKSLIEAVGNDWTYWIFAAICVISCPFVIVFLPETKGRSSDQIQQQLLGGGASGNYGGGENVSIDTRTGNPTGESSLKAMA